MQRLLLWASTLNYSSTKVSYTMNMKNNCECNESLGMTTDRMISASGRTHEGFPHRYFCLQHHCYHQSKTKVCTRPTGTHQVKINQMLVLLRLASFLRHHWRAESSMPFRTAFHSCITRATMKGFNFGTHIIIKRKSTSSQCLQWSSAPYNMEESGLQLKQ